MTTPAKKPPKKIDRSQAEVRLGTAYPPPYDAPCLDRKRLRLGLAAGLTKVGVNLLHLSPGTWSSQRHYHSHEDEFIYVVSGEVVLVTDSGEERLVAGDCAGFPAGARDGHHLQNRSAQEAVVLEVGTNDPQDEADYPDIDLRYAVSGFTRRDGTPFPPKG